MWPKNCGSFNPALRNRTVARSIWFPLDLQRTRDSMSHATIPACAVDLEPMITRSAKLLLLAGIALFYALIVFNNLTDFDSNYQFVRHVLMMDSTFSGNHGLWRALRSPGAHLAFYVGIIVWECVTAILLWWAVVRLLRALQRPSGIFNVEKRLAIMALTLSMLMWLVAFLTVGAEWFLMWQSQVWNGQEAAFRMFVVVGLVLMLLLQPETEGQP
jgi:predicted small integral membrane protein